MRHPPPQDSHGPQNPPASSRRLRLGLGTWVAIEARAAGGEQRAIEAAYEAITSVEARMHPSRAGSDLATINSGPLHIPLEVHPDTWRLLLLARRLYDLTDGVFDPCLPSRPGRLRDIEISSHEPAVTCHALVHLDLGGIAKGHAIDCGIERLSALGCTSGLVNAGGDLRVFGERHETVLLRQGSGTETHFRPIQLHEAALAVSDLDATERPEEHQGYYTRSAGPVASRRYAAVIAKTAAIADALTKCLLLCPPETAERVLREFDATSADA
jgi:thiamine biosynthesis lipoprotein